MAGILRRGAPRRPAAVPCETNRPGLPPRPVSSRAVSPGLPPRAADQSIALKLKAEPSLIPDGQRAVTVFVRV